MTAGLRGQLDQQAVVEAAVGAALVLAHHPDGLKAYLAVAGDRVLFGR